MFGPSKLDEFRYGIRQLDGSVCALDGHHAPGLLGVIGDFARGVDVQDSRLKALMRPSKSAATSSAPSRLPMVSGKRAAVVTCHGVALYKVEFQPYAFSTFLFAQTIEQLSNDPSVDLIVVDFDTPGGVTTGTPEAADAIWNARKKKPVIGIVNALCASAGYWIASQCTKIISVPSGDTGSIGVYLLHFDLSKMYASAGIVPTFVSAGEHKVEGNSMQPLGDDAKAWFQAGVDDTYRQFLNAVARGRGVSASIVRDTFGKGRCFDAPTALRAGMINEIAPAGRALNSALSGTQLKQQRSVSLPSADYRASLAALAQNPPSRSDRYRHLLALEEAK